MTSRRDAIRLGAGIAVLGGLGSGVSVSARSTGRDGPRLFSTGKLSGDAEVPPVETDGSGAAVFQVVDGGDAVRFVLFSVRTTDVTMAHVHLGGTDENGPVVVWLFGQEGEDGDPSAPLEQGVTETGVLAEGTFTGADLVGPLEGSTLDDLLAEMTAGNTYVNVHTEANPPGEVRGQIAATAEFSADVRETVGVSADDGGSFGTRSAATISLKRQLLDDGGETTTGGSSTNTSSDEA